MTPQKLKYNTGDILVQNGVEYFVDKISDYLCCLFENGKTTRFYRQEELDKYYYTLKTKAPWVPENGKPYWYLKSDGLILYEIFTNGIIDNFHQKTNNMFRTREEAQARYDEIMNS